MAYGLYKVVDCRFTKDTTRVTVQLLDLLPASQSVALLHCLEMAFNADLSSHIFNARD